MLKLLFYLLISFNGLSYIMAPKSVLWKLFHSDNKHYKSNKSHLNAFCIGCMKLCMDKLCSSDSKAVAIRELLAVRSNEDLKEAGQYLKELICLQNGTHHTI
jgi:hypothetical protein